MRPIPFAAPMAVWGSLFLRGRCAPDVLNERFPGISLALPEEEPQSLIMALASLRTMGTLTLRPLLPASGDIASLPLPTTLHPHLLQSGAGVMTEEGPALVFIEEIPGNWQGYLCERPLLLPDLAWADRAIRTSLQEATDALARLVKLFPPSHEDLNLIREATYEMVLPAEIPARAHHVLSLAARVAAIVEFARGAPQMSITAAEALERERHLADLEAVARSAIAAATSLSAIDRLDR